MGDTTRWPPSPSIYEINTWVWLSELEAAADTRVDLGSVPRPEWDRLAAMHVDSVWLMGVWERSAAGIAIANQSDGLLADFRHALPDFRLEDNVGSPYCVQQYVVAERLGGREGLARARRELATRGIRLLLDFVPNHTGVDHPWVEKHPEYYIRGTEQDLEKAPHNYTRVRRKAGDSILAYGRDPYFSGWPDTLQLNYGNSSLQEAMIGELLKIAGQCDLCSCALFPAAQPADVHRNGDDVRRTYSLTAG